MPIIYDARGNEYQGWLDGITGQVLTDARVATATLGALNAEALVDLNGASDVMVDLRTAAMNATIVFEATVDGTNYFGLPGLNILTQQMLAAVVITTTQATQFAVKVAGFRRFRVRVSVYTSGNLVTALRSTQAANMIIAREMPSTLVVTTTAAANAIATLTIPAGGAGLFHYITYLEITRTATAALAGTATLVITTTNLPGALSFSVGNAMNAGGTQKDFDLALASPLKSSVANTATTIVMPAPGAAVLWRANVFYYLGA